MSFATPAQLQELISQLNDVAKSYIDSPDLDGFKSRVPIIERAKKITQTLMAPADMAYHLCLNMTELVAVRTLLQLKVLENIPVTGSISLQDLAKATGAQDSLLERMLRLVVGSGFVDQTRSDGGDYVHTKFSKEFLKVTGPRKFFQAMYDEPFITMVNFHEYLKVTGTATEPDDLKRNSYIWRHGQNGTSLWDIMAQFPERFETSQLGMAGEETVPIVGYYEFSKVKTDEKDSVELVDVGGGQGQSLKEILEAHPALSPSKAVLQDRPDIIEMVKHSHILPDGVVKMGHDFCTEQPVKDEISTVLHSLHDYKDSVDVLILSQMKPDSLALIADMVMPERVYEADLPATTMDNIVLAMGGKERTEQHFRRILDEAGLTLVKVWRASAGAGALVEAKLKS